MNRKDGKSKTKSFTICNKCNDSISNYAFNRHYNVCKGINKNLRYKKEVTGLHQMNVKKIDENIYLCLDCNKEYSKTGIGSHYWRNHTNIGKIFTPNKEKSKKPGWNKGLTKELDSRLAHSEETKNKIKEKSLGRKHSESFKVSQSKKAKERGLGGVRQSKKINYNGKTLGSTYELILAKNLDDNNIKWNIPNRINYIDPFGKHRTYQPDFYLEDYNVYIDPKNDFLINNINPSLGFNDLEKISLVEIQNNLKIIVVNKNQLSWEYIKKMLP
jgi:hypothetical protein